MWSNRIVVVASFLYAAFVAASAKPTCEKIAIPMCKGMKYNLTAMPNQFGHASQEEAALEIHQFFPLVKIGFSDDLRFFLCSIYAPKCMSDYVLAVPPCRSVCERVKSRCLSIITRFGFKWPEAFNCDRFPDVQKVCMDPKKEEELKDAIDAQQERGKLPQEKPTQGSEENYQSGLCKKILDLVQILIDLAKKLRQKLV